MAWKTVNYFEVKTNDLPAKTRFNELFPELLKWDGKHPKQALYQTEPRPDIQKYGGSNRGRDEKTERIFIVWEACHSVLYTRNWKNAIIKNRIV